ncbi:LuxR family transcriptional regulator [Mucilaginibacter sp. Bleaf8]|uniref:helix-turn-helix transcriptional regulator n=1 Tax=Mucilaginibacter sp. Bleaf8 TaxID=2834430 RepID=UPI001BCCB06B|nr:LuxR C-terminal-related transcriptional regulator [Mucilaginibacter sp. Bleaf8]MBS7566399.1 LuxR family transcriptional regulator [Mucilaginibacter sp. Bleaf8]
MHAVNAAAQTLYIDSLKKALSQAPKEEKPVIMAELARVGYEKDMNRAINSAQKALLTARQNKDEGATAFCYATLGYLFIQKDQQRRAELYIDSAVKATSNTSNPALASYAWLRKGWLEMVKGNNEKSIAGFLKAEQLAKQQNDQRSLSYRTLIYHYIASIYAYGSDTLKQRKYAKACMATARLSGNADNMLLGYMTIAHGFFSAFERDTAKRMLLDSSLAYYRQAINLYRRNKEKVLIQSNASAIALNMANSYFKYFPTSCKDSAYRYVNQALTIGRQTNSKEVIANSYGILSEYALREKNFTRAEQYLQKGIAELKSAAPGVDLTRSRLMLGLANVAEQSGNTAKALAYYKQYTVFYTRVFDAQKLAITQQLEEEYQSVQRENEIARLRERADYNKQLNWLYIAIGSASIILLILLLSSYHYKLKASLQQKQLSEQEREEAKLLALLQQAEAQQLALEKQEAELKATLREEESARLQAQQELLQDRTEWLEKELLAGTLKLEEKNVILERLKKKSLDADSPSVARQIGRIINQNLRMDRNLTEQQQTLSQIHPSFFDALQERADNSLTRLDLKYCSYILMGLDNKEIANRLGVEPKSIRMARYRLKQKLKLNKDDNLDQAVRSIEKG